MKSGTCFDRGQKITEIGAALAYAQYHAARITESSLRSIHDVSSGIHTAAVTAGNLKKELKGQEGSQVASVARRLESLNGRLRIGAVRGLKPADTEEIRKETASIRKEVTKVWRRMRRACSGKGKK